MFSGGVQRTSGTAESRRARSSRTAGGGTIAANTRRVVCSMGPG